MRDGNRTRWYWSWQGIKSPTLEEWCNSAIQSQLSDLRSLNYTCILCKFTAISQKQSLSELTFLNCPLHMSCKGLTCHAWCSIGFRPVLSGIGSKLPAILYCATGRRLNESLSIVTYKRQHSIILYCWDLHIILLSACLSPYSLIEKQCNCMFR